MVDSKDKKKYIEVLDKEESRFLTENRQKKEMVSIFGLAKTIDGKITRTKWFQNLDVDLDNYDDIIFTPEEAKRINKHFNKLKTGATAMIPMYCAGSKCIFANNCVFAKMGKPPIGRQCLEETSLIKQWTYDYMEEFDIDPHNFTEVGYANELAEIMVLERRLNMGIAKPENSELVVDTSIGVDGEGDPIIQKQISPFMDLKDKLSNRRSKIIKLMVGDRQEKYKKEAALKIKEAKDPSERMAAMHSKLEQIHLTINEKEKKLRDQYNIEEKRISPEDLMNNEDEE